MFSLSTTSQCVLVCSLEVIRNVIRISPTAVRFRPVHPNDAFHFDGGIYRPSPIIQPPTFKQHTPPSTTSATTHERRRSFDDEERPPNTGTMNGLREPRGSHYLKQVGWYDRSAIETWRTSTRGKQDGWSASRDSARR